MRPQRRPEETTTWAKPRSEKMVQGAAQAAWQRALHAHPSNKKAHRGLRGGEVPDLHVADVTPFRTLW